MGWATGLVSSDMVKPLRWGEMGRSGARTDVRCRFVFHPLPDLDGHRVVALLEDVADQADGARQHPDAAHDLPWQTELAADGTDRTGGVDRQHLARQALGLGADQLLELDVVARVAVVLGDLEQSRCARVHGLVQRMAVMPCTIVV